MREIEDYFLSLMGKGIMLSSRDYDLILNWKKREIPKEVVLKGIRRAFEVDLIQKEKKDRVLDLNQIVSYVEEEIRKYRVSTGDEPTEEPDSDQKIIRKIIERLNTVIKSEKRENIRKHYLRTRNRFVRLLDSHIEDLYKAIGEIEEDFYDDFFEALSETEQSRIITEAQQKVAGRARFMTEQARYESILSFRNEILKTEYTLKNITVDV